MEDLHLKKTRISDNISVTLDGASDIKLEKYKIVSEIGRGGMAVVYKALEKSLNRLVALKVLGKDFSKDNDLVKRFVNEAQAAAKLNHPNIVQIYSIGEESGIYYFAMEYVNGKSVEDKIKDGKTIPIKEALDIIKQTVTALKEAYKSGIMHRDIKPGNLLVSEQGVVKVADFGLAGEIKVLSNVSGGRIIGTPLYMSPEQAKGKEGDHRSDMYSLGVTFYQMLTGKVPYSSRDTRELMKCQIEMPLPPMGADIPRAINNFISCLTEKDPEKRPRDYELLSDKLERIYARYESKRIVRPSFFAIFVLSIGITAYSFYNMSSIKEVRIPINTEQNRKIESIYRGVIEYARKHPESYGEIIKEYSKIIREYPNTEWSYRAEQKVDLIIAAVVKEAAGDIMKIKSVRDELLSEDKYQRAIDKYREIQNKYKDTAASNYAQENIDYIYERAKQRFQQIEDRARQFSDNYDFNEARKIYSGVINSFGIQEFIDNAKEKLVFVDELEKEHRIEEQAEDIFRPISREVDDLMKIHDYQQARAKLLDFMGDKKSRRINELVENKLTYVDEMQVEYESNVIKGKMDEQYLNYKNIINEVKKLLPQYRYDDAMSIIDKNYSNIEIKKWKEKLDDWVEKLKYLQDVKSGIINGINIKLEKNRAGVCADDDKLILIVSGGYVGITWKECAPEKICELAREFMSEDDKYKHFAMGVFCLVYKMPDNARKEFTIALRENTEGAPVIEKYLAQLSETDRGDL